MTASASTLRCTGLDGKGNHVRLVANEDSDYVIINGYSYKLVGYTRDGRGVVTENFINVSGKLVYDSIVPQGYMTLGIYQFNAVTQRLLAKAILSCDAYGVASAIKSNKLHRLLK